MPFFAFAADCPANSPPITSDADLKLAQVSNPKAVMGMCWDRNDATGTDASSAKQYLKSLNAGGVYSKCSADVRPSLDAQFANLNDTFAKCAANFLRAYQDSTHDKVQINRSSNNRQCEGQMCYKNVHCGRLATQSPNASVDSNHTAGFAMDVAANAGQNGIAQFAKQNPQFGVCFPFVGSSFNDPVHMILAGAPGTEGNGPGCAGVSRSGCEGAKFDPNSLRPAPAPVTTPPSNDPGRNLQTQPQQQQMCTIAGGYTVPCDSIKNGQTPATPSAAPAGTPASTPSSPATAANAQTIPTSVSSNLLSPSPSNPSGQLPSLQYQSATSSASIFDQLNLIANPSKNTGIGSSVATSVNITFGANDAVTLQQQSTSTQQFAQGQTYQLVPPSTQETFVSEDLSQTGATFGSPQPSTLQKILTDFKNLLLRALDYLRPFGDRLPANPGPEFQY